MAPVRPRSLDWTQRPRRPARAQAGRRPVPTCGKIGRATIFAPEGEIYVQFLSSMFHPPQGHLKKKENSVQWERRPGVKMHTFRRKSVAKCQFCVLEPVSSSTITVKVFTCETSPQARWLGLAIGCATGTGSSCALLGVGDVPRGTH